MSGESISVDIGSFDFYLRDLAETITEEALEAEMLDAMADQVSDRAKQTEHSAEKLFLEKLATRMRQLSKWIEENAP